MVQFKPSRQVLNSQSRYTARIHRADETVLGRFARDEAISKEEPLHPERRAECVERFDVCRCSLSPIGPDDPNMIWQSAQHIGIERDRDVAAEDVPAVDARAVDSAIVTVDGICERSSARRDGGSRKADARQIDRPVLEVVEERRAIVDRREERAVGLRQIVERENVRRRDRW